MNNLDLTLAELETEGETEWEAEFDTLGSEEFESEFEGEAEFYNEAELESPFDENEEMELASELLDVTDEAELEQFLGSVFKKVARKVGRFAKSSVDRKLGRVLKGVAKKALPMAGSALGRYFGGPAGARLGGQLASRAGRIFGLELEGLSPEDQEFELARQYVRFAGTATKKATLAPSTANPDVAVKTAVKAAARQHAPGLVSIAKSSGIPTGRRSGRWVRRGRRIILM